jgi:hypothetical protein
MMSGANLPCILRTTTGFAYVRMNGPDPHRLYAGSYSDTDLRWWAARLHEWDSAGKPCSSTSTATAMPTPCATPAPSQAVLGQQAPAPPPPARPSARRHDHPELSDLCTATGSCRCSMQ